MIRSSLEELAEGAPPEAVELARTILEQAISDRRWADQIGPVLSQRSVAELLDKSRQAVSQDRRLLRVEQRDGSPAYPVFQFDGRAQVGGVAEIVAVLEGVVRPLTVAAWLTASHPDLDGERPIDRLRRGRVEGVLDAARRYARAAA